MIEQWKPVCNTQFGLIAEEVADANPEAVVRDEKSEVYTGRYEAANATLLSESLKEHRKMQEQAASIAQLKKDFQATLARQQKQIEALTAGLQKVKNSSPRRVLPMANLERANSPYGESAAPDLNRSGQQSSDAQ